MPRMEVTVVKKGAKGPMDDDAMVEDAIREVAGRIDRYDTDRIMGSYRDRMRPAETGEGADMTDGPAQMVTKEECPDCAKGECTNPEHMDEGMIRQLLASMADKDEGSR